MKIKGKKNYNQTDEMKVIIKRRENKNQQQLSHNRSKVQTNNPTYLLHSLL